MRFRKILLGLSVVVLICLGLPQSAGAEDGAALYKSKCAMCHGAEGQGKVGPALKGTSLTEDQIADLVTKGQSGKKPPHVKPVNGVSDEQAKAIAAYVKTLK
jgi:mono/diheme cytochrome c family protein